MNSRKTKLLLGLGHDAFDHVPLYCQEEAMEAIAHVRRMEEERLFRPGVYYVVLTDLCGATVASQTLGMDTNRRRVEAFITICVESLAESEPKNYAHFLKPVGDAVLLLFSSFLDLYNWWNKTQKRLENRSRTEVGKFSQELAEIFWLRSKTVVHVGEIMYSDGKDPVSAAVNQVFKIEKLFKAGELGCTETARAIASPLFPDLSLIPEPRQDVILPGANAPIMTWLLQKERLHSQAESR